MYEDSHINQVSFTTHRHPTEYLRCDIHHVDDMQPQNASFRTQNTPPQNTLPLPTAPRQSNTPSLHRQMANQKNTPLTLTPKDRAMRY